MIQHDDHGSIHTIQSRAWDEREAALFRLRRVHHRLGLQSLYVRAAEDYPLRESPAPLHPPQDSTC